MATALEMTIGPRWMILSITHACRAGGEETEDTRDSQGTLSPLVTFSMEEHCPMPFSVWLVADTCPQRHEAGRASPDPDVWQITAALTRLYPQQENINNQCDDNKQLS